MTTPSYFRLHSVGVSPIFSFSILLKMILCWTIMLSSFEQILATSSNTSTNTSASATSPDSHYLTTMQKTKQKCNLLELAKRNECYTNDCSTVYANDPDSELRCRMDSCEMQFPSGDTKNNAAKTQCYTNTLKEKSLSSSDLSILEAIPAAFGLLLFGHLLLTLMKYLLNFTIFRNSTGCAFPSIALAASWGVIDNILTVISIVIFIKHSRNLYNDFKTDNLAENQLRENSFRYMQYKYDILKKYVTRQLVIISLSLTMTLIALGLALKEIAMGGGFCPVATVSTSNRTNSFPNWVNLLLTTALAENISEQLQTQGKEETGISDDIDNYISNPNIESTNETFISDLGSKVGLSSSDIGKFFLYGGAIFSVIAAIVGMFEVAILSLYPFFKGTWNPTGKMSMRSAIGRVVIYTTLSAIKIAIIVAEAIILKNIKERQRLLQAIEDKLKSYSLFDFFTLPIVNAYANDTSTSGGKYSEKSEKDEPPLIICVDANKKIDARCLCAKNNSCFQLNVNIAAPFLRGYPEANKILPLFQYINNIMGGRESLENASLSPSRNFPGQEKLAEINSNLFKNIAKRFELQNKELSRSYGGPFSANIIVEKWLANRPFEILQKKGGTLANLLEPEFYIEKLPEPKLPDDKNRHNGIYINNKNKNNISKANNTVDDNITDISSTTSSTDADDQPKFNENYEYNTVHEEPQKDLWQIISGAYIKRYSTMKSEN